jgi:hypothetical protein
MADEATSQGMAWSITANTASETFVARRDTATARMQQCRSLHVPPRARRAQLRRRPRRASGAAESAGATATPSLPLSAAPTVRGGKTPDCGDWPRAKHGGQTRADLKPARFGLSGAMDNTGGAR